MSGSTWAALACGVALVSACGGQRSSASERALVRQLVPAANHVECTRRGAVTRCLVLVERPRAMTETWNCEFAGYSKPDHSAYSGSRSCWSDR